MSIGSEITGGPSAIRVSDLSIDGSDNGLRIKSNITRGGLVHDVQFDDVCIRSTANPVFMDTHYTAIVGPEHDRPPLFRDVMLRNVRIEGGGLIRLEGLDAEHRLGLQFDNVWFDEPARIRVSASHSEIQAAPGPLNLDIAGEDVKFTRMTGTAAKNSCTGKFVDFPQE